MILPQNGRSTIRITLKTLFLVGIGHVIFDNSTFFLNLNTPEIV